MEHRDARPSKGSDVKTDIRKALEEVLYNRYLRVVKQSLQDHKVKVKKLTIIVLTDGKWDDMEGDNDVEDTIVEFAKKLKQIQGDHMQIRQVSFEFVQLGFDEGAAFRLQRLDDELPWRGVPDIVDAEHSRGDVNKMLLGSFNDGYDKRTGGLILVPSTPTNQSDYFDSSLENSHSNRQSVMGSGNLTKSPPQMESPPPEPGNVRRIDTGRGYQMSGPSHQTPSIVVDPEHSNFQSGYRPR